MTLPIDIIGAIWFVAKPVWETQDEAAATAPGSGASAAANAVAGGIEAQELLDSNPTDDGHAPDNTPHLVLEGYTYEPHYGWLPADSPLSREWVRSEAEVDVHDHDHDHDHDDHRHRPIPVVPIDITPPALDDSDPAP